MLAFASAVMLSASNGIQTAQSYLGQTFMGALIWLASYPKSGNTWLRAFLHNLLLNPDHATDINKLDQICFGDSQINWFTPFLDGRDGRFHATKCSDQNDNRVRVYLKDAL